MWSNVKKLVGGMLAALVAAALALAVVPAEAAYASADLLEISDVGTYTLEASNDEIYIVFDVPESGAYCLEFDYVSGDFDGLWLQGYAESFDPDYIESVVLYGYEGDASMTAIFQLEAGLTYQFYLAFPTDAARTIELSVTKVGTDAEDEDFVPVWRLYNPYSGEHHFTTSTGEYEALVALGWTGEGICWLAPEESSTPVYRLYNQWSGDHHYTTDATEYAALVALGWTDEGIGWYSAGATGTTATYRLYNPYVTSYYHHYTVDSNEYDTLAALGWEKEGVGWYGL